MPNAAGGIDAARTKASRRWWATRLCLVCSLPLGLLASSVNAADPDPQLLRHRALLERFAPAPGASPVARCLPCHGLLLESQPRAESPAGLKRSQATAWYQRVPTYQGEQQDFHWRHMKSDFARQVMRFECDGCHPGFDPARRLPLADDPITRKVLRKRVDPAICINCHGQYPDHFEEFSGSWRETSGLFDNTCLVCHRGDAAKRHTHPMLNRDNILRLAEREPEVCFGCHGGRAWYAVSAREIRGTAHDWRRLDTRPPARGRPGEAGRVIR